MYTANLSDALISRQGGFVYCLFAPRFGSAYIGQTLSASGPLGRLNQHVGFGSSNTFRRRLCENFRYESVDMGPILFEACELERSRPEFHNRARDHREAVEALTQFELLNKFAEDSFASCVIISRVSLNPYAQVPYVKAMSDKVVQRIYTRSCRLRAAADWGH